MTLAFDTKLFAVKTSPRRRAKPTMFVLHTWLARSAVTGAFLYVAGIVLLI